MNATSWLDELGKAAPEDYRAAVDAETRARDRHASLAGRIIDLETRLAAAVEADRRARLVARMGGELVGLRTALDQLPAIPVVSDAEHARVATQAAVLWATAAMPAPPMIAAEMVHWRVNHNMGAPEPGPAEQGLVNAYEALSDRAAAAHTAAQDLRQSLRESPVAAQIERWRQTRDELDGVNDAVREMTDRITVADTERRESGAQHRCHSFEGATPLPLRAPAVGWPWRLEYQPDPGLTDTAEGRAAWLNRPRPGFNPRPEPGSLWATIGAGR
ncbi:MAG TPA: hypothetical protein VGL39_07645 [Jatrophihabitantaceae bacterium]|jgi:hypothetical protein